MAAAEEDNLSTDTLVIEGEPLKSLATKDGKVRVGAYAVRFSKADEKDLTGEYFTAKTDFGPRNGDGVATMFNHGLPLVKNVKALADVAEMTFGPVKTMKDDVGIFAETTLDVANQYEKAIADLCDAGKLRWSSGSSAHIARKSADGEITRWHPIEFSFTPKAAEPRLPAIRPLKAIEVLEIKDICAAFGVDIPKPAAPAAPPVKTTPVITIMEPTEAEKAAQKAHREKEIADAVKIRTGEITEIHAIGDRFNCREAAAQFVSAGKSVDEFRDHVLKDVVKAAPVVTTPVLGMDRKDVKAYSLVKAIREIAQGGFVANALTGIEKEASDATAKSINKRPNGFFIPHDVAAAGFAESQELGNEGVKALLGALKALNQNQFASGGALVGTNLLTGSIVELLRNKPLVAQMGAMTLTGLVGNVAVPQITGGATAYWLNEQGAVTESDQQFAQLGFTPKKLIGRTGYTKELMNQTDLSIEALVRNDLTTVIAIAKDLAAINGLGGAQPLGILNTTGVGSVTFGGAATRLSAISFQQKVAIANASRGNLQFMTTPNTAGRWMGIPEVPNYPTWLWQGNVDAGVVVGRSAQTTNQVPNDRVIYGNWNDLMLLDWAGIDVSVNPYSGDAQGIITITITLWTDSGLRHAVSFAISTDAGSQ